MTVGIWGDSIAYGQCDSEALGWVGRLRKYLNQKDMRTNVYNFSVCGDTTEEILTRFQIEARAVLPMQIFFAIGINDSTKNAQGENYIAIDTYTSNLTRLIYAAKEFSSHIVIVGATRVDESICNEGDYFFYNSEIEKYNTVMKDIASEHGLVFIDMFSALENADLADGLHPNAQGYEKMLERIKDVAISF